MPAGAPGQRVYLEFEGIRMAGVVYLNGKLLGRHEDGVSAFGFDITDALKPAEEDNLLAVRTDNDFKYKGARHRHGPTTGTTPTSTRTTAASARTSGCM